MCGELLKLMCQKGIYPYERFDIIDKHEVCSNTSNRGLAFIIEASNSKHIILQSSYHVYEYLQCFNLEYYNVVYLKCDVLLLSDVFEQVRKTCMEYYKLDLANDLTAP